ncbi:hypothetical protein SAMN05421747_12320 [Parapedobacter composti]|uniref:Uncharacterized protein n=1 Tax=Parapedobacter composti TaxID=623281 RepID=A0A1I1LQJ8_9SPHI|nr:hypothetical protein SAMN05421747_12320 [Parapedobacter composti]
MAKATPHYQLPFTGNQHDVAAVKGNHMVGLDHFTVFDYRNVSSEYRKIRLDKRLYNAMLGTGLAYAEGGKTDMDRILLAGETLGWYGLKYPDRASRPTSLRINFTWFTTNSPGQALPHHPWHSQLFCREFWTKTRAPEPPRQWQ